MVTLSGRHPVPLRGSSRLGFSFLQGFEATRGEVPPLGWTARIVGYSYGLHAVDGQEMLAFHWHPVSRSPVTEPHLYLDTMIAGIDFRKAHLPTSFVALSALLRFLILDLGVKPIRSDWRDILTNRE